MNKILMLLQVATRNLFASFLNVVIGAIILVGTTLFVIGGSLLNSVDHAMSKSITGSIAGDVQVYSSKSKDDLALYGNWSTPDLAVVPDFSKIKPALMSVENVKTVIPMGVSGAGVTYGNTVDLVLEKLRNAVNRKIQGDHSAELREKIESLKSHARQIIGVIQSDYKKLTVMASDQAVDLEAAKDLEKAASPAFWAGFDSDPLNHLEFMENKIASIVPDADYIFFQYVGTDLDAFKNSFDRMQIVDGQMVPPGQRGMLLSKYVYEHQFKLKTAYRLDKINEALTDEGKKISKDPDLQLMVKQNKTQVRELLLQLDPLSAKKAAEALQSYLKTQESDLNALLGQFFDTDDANFSERYKLFYKEIAPLVELYRLRPGDLLTIKSYTKSGFVQASNIKVYGTFQFKGLEKSGLAGGISLMDLMTFRDLYGYATPEKLAETRELEKSTGTGFIDRDKAEAELFGTGAAVTQGKQNKIDENAELGGVKYNVQSQNVLNRKYSQNEIEKGEILNAAVILKDPRKIKETMAQIEKISKDQNLDLKVVTWQKAAGNIGQFVYVAKAALYFAVFIIFIVALVIINNAVMMATLQRIKEIGTMRAIGAQKGFVLSLVLIETVLLGITFGLAGTFLGTLIVKWLGIKGIPAVNEFLYFFFSGPRLYATVGVGSLVGAFVIICVVTSISALYPAVVATRISPIQAMGADE